MNCGTKAQNLRADMTVPHTTLEISSNYNRDLSLTFIF